MTDIKLAPDAEAAIARFAKELKQYTTEQIETLVRKIIDGDMREMRRKYPELFRK